MIKKIFISLLVVFWLCLSFSNAVVNLTTVNVGETVSSVYNNSYSMLVNRYWLFLTQYVWIWKQVLMYNNYDYFFFNNNWLPYMSHSAYWTNYTHDQWSPIDYLLCDEIWIWWTTVSNCDRKIYTANTWVVSRIMKNLSTFSYWTFVQSNAVNENYQWWLYCFSSSSLWKSICFYWCSHTNCWTTTTDSIWWYVPTKNLSSSANLWSSLESIPNDVLGYYPWAFEGGYLDWSSDVWIVDYTTWDYYYSTCTYKDLFNQLEYYWYNQYLCYWWMDNRDLYDPTVTYTVYPWQWLTLAQIYTYTNEWKSYQEWFNYRRHMYLDYTWNVDNALWQQKPAVMYQWFWLYVKYWWDQLEFPAVHEYCLMKQMITWDAINWKYWWTYFKNTCWSIIQQKLNWTFLNDSSYTWPSSWDYVYETVVWVNRNNVWENSWSTVVSTPINFLQNFFDTLKANMNTNNFWTWSWFIPWYIIIALLWLIIFRFLSH